MSIDPYILAFSAITVLVTIWMGFWSAKKSKTASDFFVAGRSVSVGWNASAISGEYLSAASFMGIAGMVMSSGYDALWYPVCYACGYLFLLLFIAGPLRRFGAYTIPDFAEGRFDSPLFRKIAVVFVLFIGFFYTMPQMKGAGTTLAYIFPGLPYWAGVVLVGAVITLNVALGGMKGITLVQAFQYWAKMFAISVPVFVLMAVYGHYGKQIERNASAPAKLPFAAAFELANALSNSPLSSPMQFVSAQNTLTFTQALNNSSAAKNYAKKVLRTDQYRFSTNRPMFVELREAYAYLSGKAVFYYGDARDEQRVAFDNSPYLASAATASAIEEIFRTNGSLIFQLNNTQAVILNPKHLARLSNVLVSTEKNLPSKAPADATWLNPFGPLTTKAAKNAAAAIGKQASQGTESIALRPGLSPDQRMTVNLDSPTVAQALGVFADLTGRQLLPNTNSMAEQVDDLLGGKLSQLKLVARTPTADSGVREHADGPFTAMEVKTAIGAHLRMNGLAVVPVEEKGLRVERVVRQQDAGGTLAPEKAWLARHERPLALLYTYSLIIAIVCGTAGLPHILVRFYTNPDGTAAKRTTMWVMILIGVFYLFPPVFGVIGRNLLPELYAATGAKGTDKIVLELPRLLNAKYAPLGSILSGIACAGAFAAFMSTFSGLLVSMTGALAHDVYGRILRPKATADERMRMFKIGAVIIGAVAIVLGMQVEQLQINFMVGQAFAIAAASYFPLLFMAVWWRKLTMKGAAAGMLAGGLLALTGISLTSFSDLKWIDLTGFWAAHPLLRILCEQPAIWAVPLAILLMVVVSKLTAREVPSDIRMKMLVLHAPEQLGLKQEYIQEHQPH